MPKARKETDISVGDVFWTSFIDNHGKKVFKHPFVVINDTNDGFLQILDARAILGAVAVTDIHSKKGTELMESFEQALYDKSTISIAEGAKKPSIAQLDTYFLFSKDLLPKDISRMFSKEKTKEIVRTFIDLMSEGKVFINKSNLQPVVILDEEANFENEERVRKI